MKRSFALALTFVLATLIFAVLEEVSFAQAPPASTFQLTLNAIGVPGKTSVAGTAAGAMVSLTNNFAVGNFDVIAPGDNLQYFAGRFNYRLPVLSTKLNNLAPNLNGTRFLFTLTGSAGVVRITGPVAAQHYGVTAGGRVDYALTSSGLFQFGGEAQWAKFPGVNNSTFIASIGPSINWGH